MTTDSQGPRAKAKRPAIRGPFSLFHVKQKDAAGSQRRKAAQQKTARRARRATKETRRARRARTPAPGPLHYVMSSTDRGPLQIGFACLHLLIINKGDRV